MAYELDEVRNTSKAHADDYLARERRELEQLRFRIGSEVADKLDRIVARDLLHAQRDVEFAELCGEERPAEPATYRVMFTLKNGRPDPQALGAAPSRRKRRIRVNQMRRRGDRALGSIVDDVEKRGGKVLDRFWLTHSVTAEVNEEQLVVLAARNDVRVVNHLKDTIAIHLDISRPLIQADQVEALGITGSDVDVAILDTGVDFSHAGLTGVTGSQFDFTAAAEGIGDFHGHGTHCAGVVASQDRTYRGVAPGAVIHDYKWLDQNGSSGAAGAAAGAAVAVGVIQQAVSDGMDVLSNSWGFTHANDYWVDPDGTCVLCTAADAAGAAGSVFVVSAGNSNNDTCSSYDTHIGCPGNARTAITIGASDDSDNMASFSSLGPTPDGRAKPDVVAPGVDIVSLRSSTGSDMGGSAPVVDTNFSEASGTSMSGPHVAGVCALMLEKNSGLTPQQIKDILMATAVDIGADPTTEMGAGRVDALAAVNAS